MKPSVTSNVDSPPGSSLAKSTLEKNNSLSTPGDEEEDTASLQKLPAALSSSVPDGLDHVRYRPPDKNSFIFDVTTGYRFDPSTGLHYDANSEFFINFPMGVMLRWDPEFNTYVRAGDFSCLGKPLITCAVQDLATDVLLSAEPIIKSERMSPKKESSYLGNSEFNVPSFKRKRCHRKSDDGPDTPKRRKKEKRSRAGRSKHRGQRSDSSCDRKKERSISRERNQSNMDVREERKSSSWEPRSGQNGDTNRSHNRDSRKRPSRHIHRRSLSRRSDSSSDRKKERSISRERNRSNMDVRDARRSSSWGSRSGRKIYTNRRSSSREIRRKRLSGDILQRSRRRSDSSSDRKKERSISRERNRSKLNVREARSSSWGSRSGRNTDNNRGSHFRSIHRKSPSNNSLRKSPSVNNCRIHRGGTCENLPRETISRYSEDSNSRRRVTRRSSSKRSSGSSALSPSPTPSLLEAELLDRSGAFKELDRRTNRAHKSRYHKKRLRDASTQNDPSPKRKKHKSKRTISPSKAAYPHQRNEPGEQGLHVNIIDDCSSISDGEIVSNCDSSSSNVDDHGDKILPIGVTSKIIMEDVSDLQPDSLVEGKSLTSGVETNESLNTVSSPNKEPNDSATVSNGILGTDLCENSSEKMDIEEGISGSQSISVVEDETQADIQEIEGQSCIRSPNKKHITVMPSKHDKNEETCQNNDLGVESSKEASKVLDSIELSDDEATPQTTVVDHGDVLGHLFANDREPVSNILLIAPVPLPNQSKSDSVVLRKQIGNPQGLFKVYINHESSSGSPWDFMVASFKSFHDAKRWYDSLKGTIELCGGGLKLKAYLHFMQKGNWNCKNCKSFNFFMQTICPKCYVTKDGGFSPISISKDPTSCVGIAKLDGNFLSGDNVVKSLPPADFNISSTKVIKEPKGLPLGLCVFEVQTVDEGIRLHDFLIQQEKHAIYVKINKPPDEVYLDQLFAKSSPSKILHISLIPLSTTPNKQLELSLMKFYVEMLLEEDSVLYKGITMRLDVSVGAPFSYALVTFDNTKAASEWLELRQRKYTNIIITSPNQTSKVSSHFSEDDWTCKGCHSLNFSLRSLCHRCFGQPDPDLVGPISLSPTATRWVAISEMSLWSKLNEDIVLHYRDILKEFVFKGTDVVRDETCPPLPLAFVFEMHDTVECSRLKEYLEKEGKHPSFVDVHKVLNEHPVEDPSCEDVMIVDEPPECIDLTEIEDDSVTQPPENREPSVTNPKAAAATRKQPSLVCLPPPQPAPVVFPMPHSTRPLQVSQVLSYVPSLPVVFPSVPTNPPNIHTTIAQQPRGIPVPSSSRQPLPMRVSYKVPFKHPGDIITISPVPNPGQEAAMFYTQLFLNSAVDIDYVNYCNMNSFGVPHNYCIVKFKTAEKARRWFERRQGRMEIKYQIFPGIRVDRFKPMDAYSHFIGANWHCDCGSDNSPERHVCFKCYSQRGEYEPPVENTLMPTRFLGVKLHAWKSTNQLLAIFPPQHSLQVNYRVSNIMHIGDPMLHRDHGLFVFTTLTVNAAIKLQDFCRKSLFVKSTCFVVMKYPNAGAISELDSNFSPVVSLRIVNNELDFRSITGNTKERPFEIGNARKAVLPDYDTFVWTSLFDYYLDITSTNIVSIVPCPGDRELDQKARAQIMASLQRIALAPNDLIFCDKRDHGSPFSYCLVSFAEKNSAQRWLDSSKGTFVFKVPPPDDIRVVPNFHNCFSLKSTSKSDWHYFIESRLHYSLPNWLCKCGSFNFSLRILCHNCFEDKNSSHHANSYYVVSPNPTHFVGIKLTKYFANLEPAHFLGVRYIGVKGIVVENVRICLDRSFPNDPCGLIIFQTPNIIAAGHLFKYLTALSQKKDDNLLVRDTKLVLDSSMKGQIIYIRWNKTARSNWMRFESENWDRYFSIVHPTDLIAIYDRSFVTGAGPKFKYPFTTFGGRICKYKKGGGFYSTFFTVSFPTPQDATKWFSSNNGVLSDCHRANLYFAPHIWHCRRCRAPNFPVRLICYKCYEHRLGDSTPLKSSASPTRWVGVPDHVGTHIPCKKSQAFDVLSSSYFKFRSVRIITDPVVRQDGPSLLVFEVPSPAIGEQLKKLFTTQGIESKFFDVHEPSGTEICVYEECSLPEVIETIVLDEGENPCEPVESSSTCDGQVHDIESSNSEAASFSAILCKQRSKRSYAAVTAGSGSGCRRQKPISEPSHKEKPAVSGSGQNQVSKPLNSATPAGLGNPHEQHRPSAEGKPADSYSGPEQASESPEPEFQVLSSNATTEKNHLTPSAPAQLAVPSNVHELIDKPPNLEETAVFRTETSEQEALTGPSSKDCTDVSGTPTANSKNLDLQGSGQNPSPACVGQTHSVPPSDSDASETTKNPEKPTVQLFTLTRVEAGKCSLPAQSDDPGSACSGPKRPSEQNIDSDRSELTREVLGTPTPVVIPLENPERTVFPDSEQQQLSTNLSNVDTSPTLSCLTPVVSARQLEMSEAVVTSMKLPANPAISGIPSNGRRTPNKLSATADTPNPSKATSKDSVMSNAMVIPDYETLVWTSVYHSCLINPPSKIVMISLCPGGQVLHDEAKNQIVTSIKDAGVDHETIHYRYRREVGSPFSYCLILFESVDSARTWVNHCNATFRFNIRWPKNVKTPINFENCFSLDTSKGDMSHYIESNLHYASPDWVCSCGALNFFVRSLCHSCFVRKHGASEIVSKSVDGGGSSNFVGIKLTKFFPRLDIDPIEVFKNSGCALSKIVLCMDPQLPRDPCGLLAFDLTSIEEGIKFFKYLTEPRGVLSRVMKSSSGIVFLKCTDHLKSRGYPGSLELLSKTQSPAETVIMQYRDPKTPLLLRVPYGGVITQWKQFIGFFPQSCLVHFPTLEAAKKWVDENGGMLKIDVEPQPAILCFIQDPWSCRQCGALNFPMRVLCYQCFDHNGNGSSPLKLSTTPTKWVGIANNIGTNNSHKLAIEFLAKTTLVRSIRVYTDPNVRLDGTFVVIFEAISVDIASQLHRVFGDKKWKNSFFIVNEYSEPTFDGGTCSSTSDAPALRDCQVTDGNAAVNELSIPKDTSGTPSSCSVVNTAAEDTTFPEGSSGKRSKHDSHGDAHEEDNAVKKMQSPNHTAEKSSKYDPLEAVHGENTAVTVKEVSTSLLKDSDDPGGKFNSKEDISGDNVFKRELPAPADVYKSPRQCEEEDGYETVDEYKEEVDTNYVSYDSSLPAGCCSRVENLKISSSFSLASSSVAPSLAAAPDDFTDENFTRHSGPNTTGES